MFTKRTKCESRKRKSAERGIGGRGISRRRNSCWDYCLIKVVICMRSLILPYKADREALLCRARQADITVKPIALGDPTPGTSCHNARPPDLPPGLPCLQAHRMRLCGCFTYYPSLHMFRCRVCTMCRTGRLHSCVYCSVCMRVSRPVWRGKEGGDSSDKLPHLGRFRKEWKEPWGGFHLWDGKKKRQNQDGVSVKEDEKAGERVKNEGGERRKRAR